MRILASSLSSWASCALVTRRRHRCCGWTAKKRVFSSVRLLSHSNAARCSSRNAVDRKSTRLNSSHGYISYAVFCLKKKNTVVAGGTADDREGYFVRPTVVECTDPVHEVFTTEYFGPVLAVHVFDYERFEDTVRHD